MVDEDSPSIEETCGGVPRCFGLVFGREIQQSIKVSRKSGAWPMKELLPCQEFIKFTHRDEQGRGLTVASRSYQPAILRAAHPHFAPEQPSH